MVIENKEKRHDPRFGGVLCMLPDCRGSLRGAREIRSYVIGVDTTGPKIVLSTENAEVIDQEIRTTGLHVTQKDVLRWIDYQNRHPSGPAIASIRRKLAFDPVIIGSALRTLSLGDSHELLGHSATVYTDAFQAYALGLR